MRDLHLVMALALFAARPAVAEEPTTYRISAGDTIEVSVIPQQSFGRTITVQPDGRIAYPVVGQIQAAGLTVAQLSEALRHGLARDLVGPRVTVMLKGLTMQVAPRASLLGAVRNPGVFPLREKTTLAELLAAAGGPLPIADLHRIAITHPDGAVTTLDLADSDRTGRLDRNVAIRTGDIVVVPAGPPATVLVLGEVTKPGSFELTGEARLLDALSLAGGPTPKADLRRVSLRRAGGTEARALDIHQLLIAGTASNGEANLLLRAGDTIVIGETEQMVYVLGRVNRPDTYAIGANDRVLDALAKAGGAAPEGDVTTLVLIRRDAGGQPVTKALDLKKMMRRGDMAQNDLLQPGDVLFVPDRKVRRSPADIANLIWPVTGIIRSFRK